jgi:peptidoglycan/LPS O-acetylase OafA/YrhL
MFTTKAASSFEYGLIGQEKDDCIDLEALIRTDHGVTTDSNAQWHTLNATSQEPTLFHRLLCYPPQGSLKLRSTSWLDGVRDVAALEVYLFHTMGLWITLYPAFHSSPDQNNPLQLPLIRTIFVSGPAAVSLFFAISGYVLTQSSLRSIRERSPEKVYAAVSSSMFRRGFRLYLPPIALTFCEMVASRFSIGPPLNFTFVPEASSAAQFVDWLAETNRFINPFHNFSRAVQGSTTYTKYDAVIWTLPLEFYGSFVCYILLLLLARLPAHYPRMCTVAAISLLSMLLGSWHFSCFTAGMLLADYNLHQESATSTSSPGPKHRIFWTAVLALSFYTAGLPTFALSDANLKPMPGFETIRSLTPTWLHLEDHARFGWSISGVWLLVSISQLPRLKALFETSFCQYLGKISFSLYLIHEFCIVLFGLKIQAWLMHLVGVESHAHTLQYWFVCGVWYGLFTLLMFAWAAQVERWVDMPSVKFARWLEEKCLKLYCMYYTDRF